MSGLMHAAGYTILASGNLATAPASGATKTLWDPRDVDHKAESTRQWHRFKRILIWVYSSHVSGTDGLKVQETVADGETLRDLVTFTVPATTVFKRSVEVYAPIGKVVYVNSANTLTAFEWAVLGDPIERAPGS